MLDAGGDEVARRMTGKGTIRFKPEDPLPNRAVAKIAKARKARDRRWWSLGRLGGIAT